MHSLVHTASPAELAFISGLDYDQDSEKHYHELCEVIFERGGVFKDGEFWFSLEVIELGSNSITPGHEREFTICCLLVLSAINSGHCFSYDRESKYSAIKPLLQKLPNELANILVEAFAADH